MLLLFFSFLLHLAASHFIALRHTLCVPQRLGTWVSWDHKTFQATYWLSQNSLKAITWGISNINERPRRHIDFVIEVNVFPYKLERELKERENRVFLSPPLTLLSAVLSSGCHGLRLTACPWHSQPRRSSWRWWRSLARSRHDLSLVQV